MGTVELFFKLIRYSIKGDKLSKEALKGVSEEQLRSLFDLSKNHDATHLITYALYENGLIDKDHPLYKKFVYEQSLAVFRYENINYELENICKVLDKNQIEHIPLKGSVIRSLYPQPWMRTSCDIDVLIHKEEVDKVVELFTNQLGCKLEFVYDYEASMYTPRNVHIEFHFNLVAEREDKIVSTVLDDVWETSTVKDGYQYSKVMSDEMFYFYHISHMAKHFNASGCGVRPFIDLWLLDNVKKGNEEKRTELLEKGELLKFTKAIKKVVDVWMNGDKHDDFSQEIEYYILQSGTYGTAENWALYYQNKSGGKTRYALSRIFLSYKNLSRQYPVLEKHKWLYPFCQVARWFRLIFCGGIRRSAKELKEIKNRPDEKIKQRENMMKTLGLWK